MPSVIIIFKKIRESNGLRAYDEETGLDKHKSSSKVGPADWEEAEGHPKAEWLDGEISGVTNLHREEWRRWWAVKALEELWSKEE